MRFSFGFRLRNSRRSRVGAQLVSPGEADSTWRSRAGGWPGGCPPEIDCTTPVAACGVVSARARQRYERFSGGAFVAGVLAESLKESLESLKETLTIFRPKVRRTS